MLNRTTKIAPHTAHGSTSTATTPCLLFTLPAELRNLIYTFSWASQTFEASIINVPRIDSVLAIPKTIVHKNNATLAPRQKGMPISLTTCKQILKEGMNVLSREYAFTSSHLPQRLQGKVLAADDALNRLIFAAIKTVVLNVRTSSCIKAAHPGELAQDSDTEVTAGVELARWYVCPILGGQMAIPGAHRVQRQRMLVVELWRSDEAMLDILHEAGVVVKEMRMHWTYYVFGVFLGDEVVLRNVAGEDRGCEEDGVKVEDELSVRWREEVRKGHDRVFGYGCMKRFVTVERSVE